MSTAHETAAQSQKRHRIPDNIMSSDSKMEVAFTTNPTFINLLRKTTAEHLRPQEGKIFVAQRTDKITDVWKVIYLLMI
jgi:hypothetical protein